MKNKKYFCYEIYKNLAIWSRNGKITYGPCCFYDGKYGDFDRINLNDVWNSDAHNELKYCIENDIPIQGCNVCYSDEEAGLQSRRNAVVNLYEKYLCDDILEDSSPISIDYSVGNLCNLKCLICNPENSTSLIQEYKTLVSSDISRFKYKKNIQLEMSEEYLKNIRNIHFHGGGEPFLSDNHINLLKKVKKVKGLSDVHVFYNTNGSIKVSNEVLNLWSECQLVELYFSIDDIRDRFEYQRSGLLWDKLSDNLLWYYKNMPNNHMFKINCVYSYLNFYYLDELVQWQRENFKENRLGDEIQLIFQKVMKYDPLHDFSLNFLTEYQYNILLEKFKTYPVLINLLKSVSIDNTDHNSFFDQIQKFDNVRGTDYIRVFPEWSNLLSRNS